MAPNLSGHDVSHGDILFQIGELKGQLGTLVALVGQKREDINSCFLRVGALERIVVPREEIDDNNARIGIIKEQMARWAGITVAVSFGLPIALTFLVTALSPRLHFGNQPDPTSMTHPRLNP